MQVDSLRSALNNQGWDNRLPGYFVCSGYPRGVTKWSSIGSGSEFSLGSWPAPHSHQPTDLLHEAVNCFEPVFTLGNGTNPTV